MPTCQLAYCFMLGFAVDIHVLIKTFNSAVLRYAVNRRATRLAEYVPHAKPRLHLHNCINMYKLVTCVSRMLQFRLRSSRLS